MSFAVRIFVQLFLVVSLLVPAVGVTAQTSSESLQIVSSRHKFTPEADESSPSDSADHDLVVLNRSEATKRRPANYEARRLSTTTLRKKISARSAIVMDAASEKTLYSHSPDFPGQPASTIKVLTGLISMDSLQKNELVPVSRRAARMPRSKVYLRNGKKYPANDLINAVLLASANDASVALAEKIGGSEKVFAQLMTAKARSFGASNTICKTASGLTALGQKTTARDLAKIFNKAMDNSQFSRKMTRTKVRTRDGKVLRSHNKALWQVAGAKGGKTGFTNAARQTYVGKFERGQDAIIVAFMGSESMWEDVEKLVEYGFARKRFLNDRVAAARQNEQTAMKLVQLDALSQQGSNPLVLTGISKRPSL